MPPERFKGKNYSELCDVWAYGCILYQFVTMKMAFDGNNFDDIMKAKYDKKALDKVNPLFRNLILDILTFEDERISINEVCKRLDQVDMKNFSALDMS